MDSIAELGTTGNDDLETDIWARNQYDFTTFVINWRLSHFSLFRGAWSEWNMEGLIKQFKNAECTKQAYAVSSLMGLNYIAGGYAALLLSL